MSQKNWLSVLFWFLSLPAIYAQADSSLVQYKARLINAETEEEVPFAHIILLSSEMGITSDNQGYFKTSLPTDDTLLISSIGFETFKIPVAELKPDSVVNMIRLTPRMYELSEIMVTQYPSYEKLREIVTNPVLTQEEKDIFRVYENMEKVGLKTIAKESGRKSARGPITTIYNLFSKEAKSQRKYAELIEQDQKEWGYHKRINAAVIKRITGLSDSLEIIQFIKFCNFDETFLNNSSDYELFSLILRKFESFK